MNSCPDEIVLASLIDGTLASDQAMTVRDHVASCSRCQAVAGVVIREIRDPSPEDLARGRHDHTQTSMVDSARTVGSRKPLLWGTAAAGVLAAVLVAQLLERPDESSAPDQHRSQAAPAADVESLQLVSPQSGQVVPTDGMVVRWAPVADSPYYDVRVVTDAGDIVVQERVGSTQWQLPAATSLKPGTTYYVHVDAYPAGSRVLSSDHVRIQVQK
jgi:hypothetical protein